MGTIIDFLEKIDKIGEIRRNLSYLKSKDTFTERCQKSGIQTTTSSYHKHFRDGDSDNRIEGFPHIAKIGTIITVNNEKYVCINNYSTPSEYRAANGGKESTTWAKLSDINKFFEENKNRAAIDRLNACKLPLILIEELPWIDFEQLLAEKSAYESSFYHTWDNRSYKVIYYKDLIAIVEHEKGAKSDCKGGATPYHYTTCLGQWDRNTGEDKTKEYNAYLKRQKYREIVAKAESKGLSKEMAKKFAKARIRWKWEVLPNLSELLDYNLSAWERQTIGKEGFNNGIAKGLE